MFIMTLVRCKARIGRKRTCVLNTRRGYYCPYHSAKLLGVRVKKSTVSRAGLGLFATRRFRKGEIIDEYKGKIETLIKNNKSYKYGYKLLDNSVINSLKSTDCFSRYINDGMSNRRNNCYFVEISGRVYVKAIKEINAGEEFFVSYGPKYWNPGKKDRHL